MSTPNRKQNVIDATASDNQQFNQYIFQNLTLLPQNLTPSVTYKLLILNGKFCYPHAPVWH
jgi:hypothetical protein